MSHALAYALWVAPSDGRRPRYIAVCRCHYGQSLLSPSGTPTVVGRTRLAVAS